MRCNQTLVGANQIATRLRRFYLRCDVVESEPSCVRACHGDEDGQEKSSNITHDNTYHKTPMADNRQAKRVEENPKLLYYVDRV